MNKQNLRKIETAVKETGKKINYISFSMVNLLDQIYVNVLCIFMMRKLILVL